MDQLVFKYRLELIVVHMNLAISDEGFGRKKVSPWCFVINI